MTAPFNFADLSKSSEPYKRKSRAKDPNNPTKGGRPPGALNKRTIAAIEKAKVNASVVHKLSLTSLRETARYLGSAMALKQPWEPDGGLRSGGDYKVFMELAVLQLRYLEAITPYEAPRLNAVAFVAPESQELSDVTLVEHCQRLERMGLPKPVIEGDYYDETAAGEGEEAA